MKFIPRAKRKALEKKLATLETFSDEAKAIRGKLGWGEPTPPAPPAPEPVVEAPAPQKERRIEPLIINHWRYYGKEEEIYAQPKVY